MRLEASTRINRPVEDVFEFVAVNHFRNHPRWDSNIVELTPMQSGPVAVGSTARVQRRKGADNEVLEVVEFEPPRHFGTRDNIGPFLLRVTCLFQPVEPRTSRLTLIADTTVAGPMRIVAPLLRPLFARQMRKSLRRIKTLVEEEPPVQ